MSGLTKSDDPPDEQEMNMTTGGPQSSSKNKNRSSVVQRRPILGKMLALLGCLGMCSINIVIKASSMTPSTMLLTRGIVHLFLFNSAQLVWVRNPVRSVKVNWKLLVIRSLVSTCAISVLFYCLPKIPLSIHAVISELGPIASLIMSVLVLKECVGPLEILLSLVAIIGVVLVTQPPFAFLGFDRVTNSLTTEQYWTMLLAMLTPACQGTMLVLLRKMSTKAQPVHVTTSTLSVAIGCTIVGLIMHVSSGNVWLPCFVYPDQIYLTLIIGYTALSQVLLYYANKFEKSPIVSSILTIKVPFLFVADYLFFPNDVQSYNYLHYLGGSIVFSSILLMLIANYLQLSKKVVRFCLEEKQAPQNTLNISTHSIDA